MIGRVRVGSFPLVLAASLCGCGVGPWRAVPTQDGRASGEWSAPANGLMGRLLVERHRIDEARGFELCLELKNAGETPLAVLTGDPHLIRARVADAKDRPIRRASGRADILYAPRWIEIAPGSIAATRADFEGGGPLCAGCQLDFGGAMWRLEPGRYRVSIACQFPENEQVAASDLRRYRGTATVWRGELAVPPVELEVFAGPPWSKPVQGASVRLRAVRPSGTLMRLPQVLADLRNDGPRALWIPLIVTFMELEVNGVWYQAPEPAPEWLAGELRARDARWGISVPLEQAWWRPGRPGKDYLQRSEGKHTVRVALTLQPSPNAADERIRVVSKPVEITILPLPGRTPASREHRVY